MSVGLAIFTLFHVAISLLGIASGVAVIAGMPQRRGRPGATAVFLVTTILFTSITGFLFPFHHLLPSHLLGVLSLTALTAALYALYVCRLDGCWYKVYTVSAVSALYLNVLALVPQLFAKVPGLKVLAPTQSEAPFKLVQLVVLFMFVVVGALATKRAQSTQALAA